MYQIGLFFKKNNKNNQSSAKGRKKKTKTRQPRMEQGALTLHQGTGAYYAALATPFSMQARGCGVPSFPSVASQKATGFLNGVAVVGVNGMGFLAVSPCLANDAGVVYYSEATYGQNSIQIDPSATGQTSRNMTSLPWDGDLLVDGTASAPSSVRGRIIATGVRVRYIGTELERGGRLVTYVSPSHSNLNGASFDRLASRAEAVRLPVSREWVEMTIFANTTDELEYPGHLYGAVGQSEYIRAVYPCSNNETLNAAGGSSTFKGAVPLAFIFTGTPGNQFEYEIITHCEYVGASTSSFVTPSHCDIEGMSKVQNAASQCGMARGGTSDRTAERSMSSAFMSFAYENRHTIVSAARAGVRLGAQIWGGPSQRRQIGNM